MTKVIPPVIPPMDSTSTNIVADNISKLKKLFPEAFTEGKVDFDALKEVLGEYIDGRDERYSFTWNGKSKARMIAQTPSTGTLRPCKEESVDWDNTQNLFIEGDNLEVLKLLQKSYHKKVKMIYIDPPYNTGKDFVYKDNFKDNIKNYKEITGQVDGEGRNLSNNPETSGRYHTDWLNMMYPRLKLARNLLKDDGVIFISISDQEIGNLRKICDEIFGEENFEGHIHWRRRHNQPNDPTKMIGLVAEHILAYARDSAFYKNAGVGKIGLTGKFSNPDNDPRGEWSTKPWKVGSDQNGSKYKIKLPSGEVLDGEWMGEEKTFERLVLDNRIVFPNDGKGAPRKKYFKFERELEGQCANNWWSHEQFGHNQEGNALLTSLMDGIKNTFSNPKPVKLIDSLISVANCKDRDIVLDFFAGSGTTVHAAFEHDSKLKVIAVQLPEKLEENNREHSSAIEFCNLNALSKSLAELTKERIRRAAAKFQAENPDYQGDLGFKVFKLDSTNIKPWELDFDLTEQDLEDQISNIKPDRKDEDVLYEVLLKYGLDLTLPITEHSIDGHKVFNIGMGALMVCLSDNISLEVAEGIAKLKDELNPEIMRVVFKDAGFADDVVKTNALQILKQAGIKDLRSL